MYIAYYYLQSARWLPGKTRLFVPWLPSLEFYQPSSRIFHTESGIPAIFISFTFFHLTPTRNNIKQHRLFCSHRIRLTKTRGKRFSTVSAATYTRRLFFFLLLGGMWNKKPTRCHLVLYLFPLYKFLNMFRATLCPSSGADDLVVFLPRVV